MTIDEIVNETNLSTSDVYNAMNHLDVQINKNSKEERWFISHIDTVPLLILLNESKSF